MSTRPPQPERIVLPDVKIEEGHHWKVGDGLDINGGETIGQIAMVFVDDTHFEVRIYNTAGKKIMTTPGVVDTQSIERNKGKIPKYDDYESRTMPVSKRRV